MNYSVRYRKGLDLVLKGLNLHVHGGEKVSYQLRVFARTLLWASSENHGVEDRVYKHATQAGIAGASSDNHAVGVPAASRLEAVGPLARNFLDFPS